MAPHLIRQVGPDDVHRVSGNKSQSYAAPAQLRLNHWGLTGIWSFRSDAAGLNGPVAGSRTSFHARDVNLVMGPAEKGASVRFRVLLDSENAGTAHEVDFDADGNGTLGAPPNVSTGQPGRPIVNRRFEIQFLDDVAEAFCFTFG